MSYAAPLVDLLKERGLSLSVAESLTGGLVADEIVKVPGASKVFSGSAVCYQEAAKIRVLKIKNSTLQKHSAVSTACAKEMVLGVQKLLGTDLGLSTTGYAGPDGKDVGLCYIGIAIKEKNAVYKIRLHANRQNTRKACALIALHILYQELNRKDKNHG
jgi:PncC family amidohydrolase